MKKIPFKNILPRITGFSTPLFGLSWDPPQSEREIVDGLITLLEDRRALYNPYDLEVPMWVSESILELRRELTAALKALDKNSNAASHVRAMRAACRKFLDNTNGGSRRRGNPYLSQLEFFTALGELRGALGIHIANLCVAYGIDLAPELETILPERPTNR